MLLSNMQNVSELCLAEISRDVSEKDILWMSLHNLYVAFLDVVDIWVLLAMVES